MKSKSELLEEHSKLLVDEVLKKWFNPYITIRNVLPDAYIIDLTPLELIISISNNQYRFQCRAVPYIYFCIEHYLLEDCDKAWEHLKEYSNSKEWVECEQLSKHYSDEVISACRYIEMGVELVQYPLINCDKERGAKNCYILDKTVDAIYQEARRYEKKGKFYNIFKKTFDDGYFKAIDSDSKFFARSLTEPPIDAFIHDVYSTAKDPNLIERMKILREKRKILSGKFKDMLNSIIDDIECGHINLKGSCEWCKPWLSQSNKAKSWIRRVLCGGKPPIGRN